MRLNERDSHRASKQAMQAQTTKVTTMMVARIRREGEGGRTISGRGQVRAPAVLEIRTRMKKLTRKMEGITKWARRNSTRKGISATTIRNGNILQMNAEIKRFQEMQIRLN